MSARLARRQSNETQRTGGQVSPKGSGGARVRRVGVATAFALFAMLVCAVPAGAAASGGAQVVNVNECTAIDVDFTLCKVERDLFNTTTTTSDNGNVSTLLQPDGHATLVGPGCSQTSDFTSKSHVLWFGGIEFGQPQEMSGAGSFRFALNACF